MSSFQKWQNFQATGWHGFREIRIQSYLVPGLYQFHLVEEVGCAQGIHLLVPYVLDNHFILPFFFKPEIYRIVSREMQIS